MCVCVKDRQTERGQESQSLTTENPKGKTPSGFSLDQYDAFTANLCKNTISQMEIFGDILKVERTSL